MSDLTAPVSPTPQDPVRDLSLGGRESLLGARSTLRQLEEQRNALRYLGELAAVDHDLEAKVQALGIELNAPDHLVRQNFEQAAGLLEARRIQDANLIEQAPVLYGQLHDPKWAAIAIDDWERLSFTEQLGRAIDREDYRKEIAEIQTEVIGKINAGVSYQEALSAKDRARLLELDKKIETLDIGDTFWAKAGEGVGQFFRAETAVGLGLALVPYAGPALATGYSGLVAYDYEAGLAFDEYLKNGVDPVIAAHYAHTTGLVNGVVEAVGFGVVAKPFTGAAKNVFRKSNLPKGLVRRIVGSAIDKPTSARAWAKTALRYTAQVGAQVGEEVIQETVTALNQKWAAEATESLRDSIVLQKPGTVLDMPQGGQIRVLDDGRLEVDAEVYYRVTGRTSEDDSVTLTKAEAGAFSRQVNQAYPIEKTLSDETFWSDLWALSVQTAKHSAQSMLFPSAIGPAIQHVSEVKRVQRAEMQRQAYEAAKGQVSQIRLQQRNAGALALLLRRQWGDGIMKELHVPKAKLLEALEKTDVPLDQLEEVFPGVKEQLAQPDDVSPTVVLDSATFFAELAETDLQQSLMEDIKPSANSYSLNEAKERRAELEAEAAKIEEAMGSVDKVRKQTKDATTRLAETVRDAAVKAGMRKRIATSTAAMFAAMQDSAARKVSEKRGTLVTAEQLTQEMLPPGMSLDQMVQPLVSQKEGRLQAKEGGVPVATSFSGAGTIEAVLTGAMSVYAAEYDAIAIGHYNRAHGTSYAPKDVTKEDPKAIAELNPALYHASPSCKNVSKAKRANKLAELDQNDVESAQAVARVIKEASPPAITIENVPGYQDTPLFDVITKALDEQGYTWDANIVNAADYGGAQSRTRLIVRAIKDGPLPPLPQKTPAKDWFAEIEDLIADAPVDPTGIPSGEMGRLRDMEARGKLDFSKPILTMGASGFKGSYAAAHAGSPAPTVVASARQVPRILFPNGVVKRVTPRMLARLMGLPDSYRIPSTLRQAKPVLGNGVHGAVTQQFIQPMLNAGANLRQTEEGKVLGEFDPTSFQVFLHKEHTPSTFTHELAHFYFEQLLRLYRNNDLPDADVADLELLATQTSDFESLQDYANADVSQRRKTHEWVAHQFEAYMREGKAPSTKLRNLFRRMSQWVKRAYGDVRRIGENYRAATGEDLPALSTEVRLVFDRWFASAEEIDIRNRELMLGRLLMNEDLDEVDKLFLQELVFDHEHQAKEKLRGLFMTELRRLRRMRAKEYRKLQREYRAERKQREDEERKGLLQESRVARALHFLSTGELFNARGELIDTFAPLKMNAAAEELRLRQEELADAKATLEEREPALSADPSLVEERAPRSQQPEEWRSRGQTEATRIRRSNERELKRLQKEVKDAEKAAAKAQDVVKKIMAQQGDAGRMRPFFSDDPRLPPRYRTTNQSQALIIDLESFAREIGYATADEMIEYIRLEMVGSLKFLKEAVREKTQRLPGDPATETMQSLVDERTDRRMLAEVPHLADPEEMQVAIDEAFTTEALMKLRAAEVNLLNKKAPAEREMLQAARSVAKSVVGRLPVAELSGRTNAIRKYTQEAQRAEVRAEKAKTKGNLEEVAEHKRTALMQRALAKEAIDRRNEVKKLSSSLTDTLKYRRDAKREDRLGRTYGGAVVETARMILNQRGIPVGSRVAESQTPDWKPYLALAADDPLRHELELDLDDANRELARLKAEGRGPTVEEELDMMFAVEGMLLRGRTLREVQLDSRTAHLDEVLEELQRRVRTERAQPLRRKSPSWWSKTWASVTKWRNTTQRLEHVMHAMDGDTYGMLSQLVFTPIRQAEDNVDQLYVKSAEQLLKLLTPLRDRVGSSAALSKPITASVDESGTPLLEDADAPGTPHAFRNGKIDILGCLIQAGNPGNLERLLLGFGWASRDEDGYVDTSNWWRQVKIWEDEGVITEEDWNLAQGVGDIFENILLPRVQKAHYELVGRELVLVDRGSPELTVRGLNGWYAPAARDPYTRTQKEVSQSEKDWLVDQLRQYPAVYRGMVKERVDNVNPDPLDIDPMRMLAHFRQAAIFAEMGPAHRRVAHLLRDKRIANTLETLRPGLKSNLLDHWLESSASLSRTLRGKERHDLLSGLEWIDSLRRNYGTAVMFTNTINSVQGITGGILAASKVDPKYLSRGLREGPRIKEIMRVSPFMLGRHKLNARAHEIYGDILGVLDGDGVFNVKKVRRWFAKKTYFLQETVQKPVDVIVWRGAYLQEAARMEAEGVEFNEARAVAAADTAVRLTQSDYAVTSMSSSEKGGRFAKLATQFSNWFINLGSLAVSPLRRATLQDRQLKEAGVTQAERAARYLTSVALAKETLAGFMTLYVGELIADMMSEKKEEEPPLDFAGSLWTTALSAPRALGVGGIALSVGIAELTNAEPYQQRMPMPAPAVMLRRMTRAVKSISTGDDINTTDAIDLIEALSMMYGIPVSVVTQRLRRGLNVFDEEDIEPSLRSLVTGRR